MQVQDLTQLKAMTAVTPRALASSIRQGCSMGESEVRRSVVVDGIQYLVAVKSSGARHLDRFGTRCYGLVELPGAWQATVPVPESIHSSTQLWYRELLELVQLARNIVSRRSAAA